MFYSRKQADTKQNCNFPQLFGAFFLALFGSESTGAHPRGRFYATKDDHHADSLRSQRTSNERSKPPTFAVRREPRVHWNPDGQE
jgi:hypothetical protein